MRRLTGSLISAVDLTFTDERLDAVKRDGVKVHLALPLTSVPKAAKLVLYPAADLVGTAIVQVR